MTLGHRQYSGEGLGREQDWGGRVSGGGGRKGTCNTFNNKNKLKKNKVKGLEELNFPELN